MLSHDQIEILSNFGTASIVHSFDEMFAAPLSAEENLRVLPAALKGDFNGLADKMAKLIEEKRTKSFSSGYPYSYEMKFISFSPELPQDNFLNSAQASMGPEEEVAFQVIKEDIAKLCQLGFNVELRVIFNYNAEVQIRHVDNFDLVLIRSYNEAGTIYTPNHNAAPIHRSERRYFVSNAEGDFQVPVGCYTLHKGVYRDSSCPSIHESPLQAEGSNPRLLILGYSQEGFSFGG